MLSEHDSFAATKRLHKISELTTYSRGRKALAHPDTDWALEHPENSYWRSGAGRSPEG